MNALILMLAAVGQTTTLNSNNDWIGGQGNGSVAIRNTPYDNGRAWTAIGLSQAREVLIRCNWSTTIPAMN